MEIVSSLYELNLYYQDNISKKYYTDSSLC